MLSEEEAYCASDAASVRDAALRAVVVVVAAAARTVVPSLSY